MNPTESHSESAAVRSLPILRAMVDALDHELLQLFAKRNRYVAEIAQYKREHQVPIRDYPREREIIEDRCERATPLGLPSEWVESLFRLVLWGSRDRQAMLKAEVPLDIEPKTVAIIGGRGAMGKCVAKLFGDLGHAVMIADLDTQLTPDKAAAVADVVVVSVPIDCTAEVIHRIGPQVRDDALLMDVSSVKRDPVEAMLKASTASVVGTHPLFAPSVHSLQGQRVVVCRGRGDQWCDWLESMFRARGLIIKESTPEEHDRAMAIVQVLVHFSTEVMGRTLARLGVGIEDTLAFTSPIYLLELIMTARHFAQSPDLYSSIQMSNPGSQKVTEAFLEAAQQLSRIVVEKNHDEFAAEFEEVRSYFGSFTAQALEQSSFLIDRLVERG